MEGFKVLVIAKNLYHFIAGYHDSLPIELVSLSVPFLSPLTKAEELEVKVDTSKQTLKVTKRGGSSIQVKADGVKEMNGVTNNQPRRSPSPGSMVNEHVNDYQSDFTYSRYN